MPQKTRFIKGSRVQLSNQISISDQKLGGSDPISVLEDGKIYKVKGVRDKIWVVQLSLVGVKGLFNAASFSLVGEQ
jgi:hypothetical protein